MITNPNTEKAKNEIKKATPPIIVKARDDKYNRTLLEYGKFDILLSPETGNRKSKLRNEDSGLNHVLAKIATKNKIAIGIDLDEISRLTPKAKAERLSKIKQNIKICRKAKTKLKILGNKKEGFYLLISLGASTNQAKEAIA